MTVIINSITVYFANTGAELGRMPDASLLAGLAEFNAEKPAEGGSDTPSLVAGLMSQLKRQQDSTKACSSMIPMGEGLPALPKKCVDKILAGEFIDLADLPPAKGKEAIPNTTDGQIVVVQAADLMEHRNSSQVLPHGCSASTFTQQWCFQKSQRGQKIV